MTARLVHTATLDIPTDGTEPFVVQAASFHSQQPSLILSANGSVFGAHLFPDVPLHCVTGRPRFLSAELS